MLFLQSLKYWLKNEHFKAVLVQMGFLLQND
jgi:hypothetical protein